MPTSYHYLSLFFYYVPFSPCIQSNFFTHRQTVTWPLPSAHRPLSAGGADALAEGHRLVPQNLTHLSEQDTQRNYFLQRLVNFLLILERMLRTKLRKNVLDILVCDVSISMPTLKYTENNKKSNSFKIINDLFI